MSDADAIASDWAAVGRDLKAAIEEYDPSPLATIKAAPKSRVWFYRPDLYWFGWKTLLPVTFGHDEWSRRTLVIGWSITGQVVIPIGYCGDDECYAETLEYIRWIQGNEGDVLTRWSEWVAGVEVNGRKFTINDPAYAMATAAFYAGWDAQKEATRSPAQRKRSRKPTPKRTSNGALPKQEPIQNQGRA